MLIPRIKNADLHPEARIINVAIGTVTTAEKLFPAIVNPIILPLIFGNQSPISLPNGSCVAPGIPMYNKILEIYNSQRSFIEPLIKKPKVTNNKDIDIIFVEPYLSKNLPAIGAMKELAIPNDKDKFICVLDHPNSSSSGITNA